MALIFNKNVRYKKKLYFFFRTEEEIALENLKDVEIPEDVKDEFNKENEKETGETYS